MFTAEQLIELAGLLAQSASKPKKSEDHGFHICVLDRGFVYVGDTTLNQNFLCISNAKNIRKWGTTNGLAELANNGPTDKTILDGPISVQVPMHAVMHLIKTDPSLWK